MRKYKKGIKSFEKDEKAMIQTLTYISNINIIINDVYTIFEYNT